MSKKYTRFRRKKMKDKRKGLFTKGRFLRRHRVAGNPLTLEELYKKGSAAKQEVTKLSRDIREQTISNRKYNKTAENIDETTRAIRTSNAELAKTERDKITAAYALERKEFREASRADIKSKREEEKASRKGGTRRRRRGGTRRRKRT